MFNPIIFLWAAREDELLDAAQVMRRIETHCLSLLGVATLVRSVVWRVHCLFAEKIIASSVFGLCSLFGQYGGARVGRLGVVALVSDLDAEFLALGGSQFSRLMLDHFRSLPTDSETLLMHLIDRAAHHAVIAAEVLA